MNHFPTSPASAGSANLLSSAGKTRREILLLTLAPLYSVARCQLDAPKAWQAVARFAVQSRLVFPIDATTHREVCEEVEIGTELEDPTRRALLEEQLRNTLLDLPPAERFAFSRRLLDVAHEIAEDSVFGLIRISENERSQLARLKALLAVGAEKIRPSTSATAVAASTVAESLVALHRLNSDLYSHGKGRLDTAKRIGDIEFGRVPTIDSGVLLLPPASEVHFVGDLHGDIEALEAVLALLEVEKKAQSDDTQIVFLGDYGDRGPGSLEVWARIASLRIKHPSMVHLLRGNHEDLIQLDATIASTGQALSRPVFIPATTNQESYFLLAAALTQFTGNEIAVADVWDVLPTFALWADGSCATHGGPLPVWKDRDGWKGSAQQREELQVTTVADLRKPRFQFLSRWADVQDKPILIYSWARFGTGFRLDSSEEDVDAFFCATGCKRLIHGHTHPLDGFEAFFEGKSVAVCTTRAVNPGTSPKIARLRDDKLTGIPIPGMNGGSREA